MGRLWKCLYYVVYDRYFGPPHLKGLDPFPRKGQHISWIPAASSAFWEGLNNPTPQQITDTQLLSAWEGKANTIWYSTDNMAKGCGSNQQTHFARATLGLSLGTWQVATPRILELSRGSGQWHRVGNTEGECFRGLSHPCQACAYRSVLPRISCRVAGCLPLSGLTLDGECGMHRPSRFWARVRQALSLLLAFLSLHYCFVLKLTQTAC